MSFIEYKSPSLPFSGTFDQAKRKKIKDMEFGISITTGNRITKKANFGSANSFLRATMIAILIPFLFSCAQTDTIAPANVEIHSTAREAASVLSTESFEDSKLANFWRPELHTATAGLLSQEQQRAGKQSLRFSWRPTQYDGTNSTMHSELATDPIAVGDTPERWYGYSVYMPSSTMANDNQPVVFSQWHGVPDPGFSDTVPPIAFWLGSDNKITLEYRASNKPIKTLLQNPTSQKVLDLGTASFDHWVDYVVHVKWDPSGKEGVLQVWQNGKLIVDEQAISIGYPQLNKPYWKAGIYAWTGKASHQERTLYYDEIRIGGATSNYNDVKPGRNDNSAK